MKEIRTRRLRAAALAALVGAFAGACGADESATQAIETAHVEDGSAVRWDVPTKERLDVRMPGPASGGASGAGGTGLDAMSAPGASDGISSVQSTVKYDAQEGWTEIAPTAVRLVNFQAGDPSVECYVTVLAGDGGGPLDNVNRWRGQVGLPPVSSADVGTMPRIPMMGGEALLIEAMGSEKAILGTVSLLPGRALFVKMIGPPDRVAQEKARFTAFCQSVALGG